MTDARFQVFVSAVTSEFGKVRDALSSDLRSRGILVRVQSDFRQEARSDTTLSKLHDYILSCDAVVCLIGRHAGDLPPAAAASCFSEVLPPGFSEASYTQWEFHFARHHRKRLSIYIADDQYVADGQISPDKNQPLQAAFERYIVSEQDFDRTYFGNEDQLCRAVLKEDWPTADTAAADAASRLLIIYNDYRDAYLSQKYYGYLLRIATQKGDAQRAAECRSFYGEYAKFTSELRLIVDDVKAARQLTDKSWNRFRQIRSRIARLEQREPFPDRSLVKRFQEEVNHEIPPQSFWMPRVDGPPETALTP